MASEGSPLCRVFGNSGWCFGSVARSRRRFAWFHYEIDACDDSGFRWNRRGDGIYLQQDVPTSQCDRETPQSWVNQGPYRWAILNGLALGSGITTRVGFWLWYMVPVAAFLSGDLILSTLVYGTYGLFRGASGWWLIVRVRRRPGWNYRTWLLGHRKLAHTITTACLAVTGCVALLIVGF